MANDLPVYTTAGCQRLSGAAARNPLTLANFRREQLQPPLAIRR